MQACFGVERGVGRDDPGAVVVGLEPFDHVAVLESDRVVVTGYRDVEVQVGAWFAERLTAAARGSVTAN